MNEKIAAVLYELSVLYSVKEASFKSKAFERAAVAVDELAEDVGDIYERDGEDGLERIPGVGPGIAARIIEYLTTKRIKEHATLKKKFPVRIGELMAIEGIGPKTLAILYRSLGIRTRLQLERAARAGKLAKIRGIGTRGQERILRGVSYLHGAPQRFRPGFLWPRIRAITDTIESWPHVRQLELVGSLRRMQETIGDLDMLAITDNAEDTLRRFTMLPQVNSVHSHGSNRALVRLKMGMDSDLWTVDKESYGAALIAWTGSKEHNIQLRTRAKKKGYLLDDYGLFKGEKMIAGRSEEEVYAALGLAYIPPEIRTGEQEIELAAQDALPVLVDYNDIRGDLQVQTDWSDGQHSILSMAKAAQVLGLEYIAITDHTKSLTIAHGLTEERLRKQWAEIDRVQKLVPGIKILKGSECDILKDGRLDLSDKTLAQLDVVGVSVHSYFNLSQAEQTVRIVRAMESPHADIVFHPTGRKVVRRAPYDVDMTALIAAAKRTKTVLEANAHPERLDLKDEYIRRAVEAGVKLSINTDAHATHELTYMRWGIGQARRGWARKRDIINTLPWQKMVKLLK
jgi:DNA polymerase (family X)